MNSSWLRCFRRLPTARTRLICCPHAGGTATVFRGWPELLPDSIELHAVQYPGREDRIREPFVPAMPELVERIVAEVAELCTSRYALFGHSMGAAVAYELALRLRALGLPEPAHLFVSGRQPPMHHHGGRIHTLTDDELADELARLSPANAELLAEPELLRIVLPIVRNDYQLIEQYQPTRARPLSTPITALIGTEDNELTAEQARDWANYTEAATRLHEFPGDHFYLLYRRREVLRTVVNALNPVPSTP